MSSLRSYHPHAPCHSFKELHLCNVVTLFPQVSWFKGAAHIHSTYRLATPQNLNIFSQSSSPLFVVGFEEGLLLLRCFCNSAQASLMKLQSGGHCSPCLWICCCHFQGTVPSGPQGFISSHCKM